MNQYEEYMDFTYATDNEDQYECYIVGEQNRDQQWILSSRDVWRRNPFYEGEDQPHPETIDYS